MDPGSDTAGLRQLAGKPAPVSAESPIASLAVRLDEEAAALDRELTEIEMLVGHARTEAARHEGKRVAVSDRLQSRTATTSEGRDLLELANQLSLLTKRAAVMEAQIDVLEGKQRTLTRYRDAARGVADQVGQLAGVSVTEVPAAGRWIWVEAGASDQAGTSGGAAPDASAILGAQEELRREIARALHDGPIQGLTNIALQAQIVERLVVSVPERAAEEVNALLDMVQATLETTKSFLFDVRPMVLDDLGLVPTLRRAVRERARADATIELESSGQDQRLRGDAESALFRIVDDVMTAYLDSGADRIIVRLDWTDQLVITIAATSAGADEPPKTKSGRDMPPALAAMIEDSRLARQPRIGDETWQEIETRAAAIGAEVELDAGGSELHVAAPIATLS